MVDSQRIALMFPVLPIDSSYLAGSCCILTKAPAEYHATLYIKDGCYIKYVSNSNNYNVTISWFMISK